MDRPWLSVIVPSHNGERWLATALHSVADQSERGIEVILVDSSDQDTSLQIAAGFSEKLQLRAYCRADLRSWTEKTNFGVSAARAAHICMLHQDDLWLPRRSGEVKKWLVAHPCSVMQMHPVYVVDETGKRRGMWRCPLPAGGAPVPERELLERLLVQNFIAIPSPVIRRDAFIRVGGLDDQLWYTADWDLYLKLSAIGDIHYHPDPLACFRVHRGSMTVTGSRSIGDFRQQMETVLDRHAVRLGRQAGKAAEAALHAARLSIAVNTALAAANLGRPAGLFKVMVALLGLGPGGLWRYFRDSRIVERVYPRLLARLAGAL
jgi:glycosyltransferase involved in cell wall biosynthesis